MRKSTIFISAVLTTFALVTLYGVVSAYRGASTNVPEAAALPTVTSAPEATATDVPAAAAPTQSATTPVQAAQLAAQVLGNHDLLSAESSSFNGVDAYLITFTNNDVVYVGLDGQILSVQVAPAIVNAIVPVQHNNSGGSSNFTQTSHERHEEHKGSGD